MDKLPNEILHSIFIQVPFEQRLKCMFVCRQWCNTLRRRSLLYALRIKSRKKYNKFKNMLRRMPNRRDQVEILELDIDPDGELNYQEFCTMLPNLRELNFMNRDCSAVNIYRDSEPLKLENVNSKLEVIKQTAECELTRRLLVSNPCTRLKSLELDIGKIRNIGEALFVHLKNAPALEDLTLLCDISINDCEILHKNAPSLKVFHLKDLMLNSGELPRDILPATSVKMFSMDMHKSIDGITNRDWYEYLTKKYTNLIELEFRDVNIAHLDTNQAMEIYQDHILPFYKMVKKQQNSFNAINISTELYIFNKLDELGLRFDSFHLIDNKDRPILTQLAESDYSKYASHVTLMNTDIPSPIIFQHFTSLKTLKIESVKSEYYFDADLAEFLNVLPPTLTFFSAFFGRVEISKLPTHSSNIEEFRLSCSHISPKLCKVISNYLPKLNRIWLQGFVAEHLNINLPNNHFSLIDIQTGFFSPLPHAFSITNTENAQPRYFIGDYPIDENEFFTNVPSDADALQDRITINIKYFSADEVYYRTARRLF